MLRPRTSSYDRPSLPLPNPLTQMYTTSRDGPWTGSPEVRDERWRVQTKSLAARATAFVRPRLVDRRKLVEDGPPKGGWPYGCDGGMVDGLRWMGWWW